MIFGVRVSYGLWVKCVKGVCVWGGFAMAGSIVRFLGYHDYTTKLP